MKLSFANIERGPGLPPSICYLRDTTIYVEIDWESDLPSPINFTVVGSSTVNGVAQIVAPGELEVSGTITVLGTTQTESGSSGRLRLVAEWNGKPVGTTTGFSVCAHPCGVRNGPDVRPHVAENSRGQFVGMFVQIGIESDSGDTTHLYEVTDREIVSEPRDHSPSMNSYPADPPEIADPEKITHFMIDRHRITWQQVMQIVGVLKSQEGFWSNDQLDLFQCPRCHMQTFTVVANSGFRLKRRFFRTDNGRNRYAIQKRPEDVQVTFDGITYRCTAGLGEVHEVEFDVEYDPPQIDPFDYSAFEAKMDEAIARKGRG